MEASRSVTRTGGRPATTGLIAGDFALGVGMPNQPAPDGWRWRKLTDVARLETGHTPSRKHPEYWGGNIPWIGIRDATRNHGRTIYDTLQKTNDTGIANSSARILPKETVCLSRTASVGYVVVMGTPMATSQDFVNWVCSPELDHRFLMYVLLSERSAFLRFASGTTHQTIYFPEVKAFHVCVPPAREQRAIAEMLGVLDGKIDLLRRMNKTLEAIAWTLFRSWFVDFTPVRSKVEGHDTGLPKHVADLFPDRLVESEVGVVPEGWTVKALGDLIELPYGKALKANNRRNDGNVEVYGSNGQIGWHDRALVRGPGIVVGRKGHPGTVTWVHTAFFPIDTTFYVAPKSDIAALYFLFYVLKLQDLSSIAADSAVPGLNRNLAYGNKQVTPDRRVLALFSRYAAPMFARRGELEAESRTLSSVRDTVLPKLMSGEVRLRQAELAVGAVL